MRDTTSITRRIKRYAALAIILLCPSLALAGTLAERQALLLDTLIAASETGELSGRLAWQAAIAKAARGETVEYALIDDLISRLPDTHNPGFDLPSATRLLYLSDGAQPAWEDELLDAALTVGFWVTVASQEQKDKYNYFSENHILLWSSSAYLLQQKYPHLPWKIDSGLYKRLKYQLQLKADIGFYEFYSSTYYPKTMEALANLADFAADPEIRSLAETALKRLLRDLLLVVTDKGEFYPAAGRNYEERYTASQIGEHCELWLLSGNGELGLADKGKGVFLATGTVDYGDVADSYRSQVYTTVSQGHSLKQSMQGLIDAGFTREERGLMHWTHGAYFNRQTADDTLYAIRKYNLYNNTALTLFGALARLPANDPTAEALARVAGTLTRGSNISRSRVTIFKDQEVALVSENTRYAGSVGWQRHPWAATVGDVAVWTQSGGIPDDWYRKNLLSDSHLPKVLQKKNVAMIVYRQNPSALPLMDFILSAGLGPLVGPLVGIDNLETTLDNRVTLHWPTGRFDEHTQVGDWLIARQDDNYIAVRREGRDYWFDGVDEYFPYADNHSGRQMWASVVGNASSHGSFSNFINVIRDAQASDSLEQEVTWTLAYKTVKIGFARIKVPYWEPKYRLKYSTRVNVDGQSLSHDWYY